MKHHILFLILSFLLLLGGLVVYGQYNGLILMASLLLFGTFTFFWKENDVKIFSLALLLVLSLANIYLNGVKYGIDFNGGTRIQVLVLDKISDQDMSELVMTIKKRASNLGLSELSVRSIGNSQVFIELPTSDEKQIESVKEILSRQGVFEGIVDGKVVIRGKDILPGTIVSSVGSPGINADWIVSFSLNSNAAKHFAQSVKGKANYPVFMFLDRPKSSLVVISSSELGSLGDFTPESIIDEINTLLSVDGSSSKAVMLEEVLQNSSLLLNGNYSEIIISNSSFSNLSESIENISSLPFKIYDDSEFSPVLSSSRGVPTVVSFKPIGLLSAPALSSSITNGQIISTYSITGSVSGNLKGKERLESARKEVRLLESLLKGGSLPASISIGNISRIAPDLGKEFLDLSITAIIAVVVIISLFVSLRYRRMKLILPIIFISLAELAIIFSFLGSFTIDLAAMAGMIAVLGVAVDAQIVITDELLKNYGSEDDRIKEAFRIIKTNVIIALVAMLPLLFSTDMVEIVGFAISTMLGSALGYMVSRPAYAALVRKFNLIN